MNRRTVFTKMQSGLLALEHWRIFRMRRRGVLWRLYLQLSQPWFLAMHFSAILDIGAHTGAWSRTISELFPEATVYAFEPLADSCAAYEQAMSGHRAFRAFNVALGDRNGPVQLHRSSFRPLSSVLPMATDEWSGLLRGASSSEVVEVAMRKLDDLVDEEQLFFPGAALAKIDVQGYEDRVIDGAQKTLLKMDYLIVETSFEELYAGQVLFDDIASTLRSLGFRYCGAIDQLSSTADGRVIQQDSLFRREDRQP
jgi:FkbM family methyltransferase